MIKRSLAKELEKLIDKEVVLLGWIHSRREHGKLTFIDLRDFTGLTQVVFDSSKVKDAKQLHNEDVVRITGKVGKRPTKYINPKIVSGKIEVECKNLEILNKAKTLPFEIDKNTSKIDEELRLKYRYLDIRSTRIKENIKARHRVISFIRNYFNNLDFVEIETPILTKGTPEGAREYIVPSRLHKGKIYVLPQAPQQFKQLLMIAGIERYYQIAKCFRDEDQRKDRQPEFTQFDLEMSFVSEEDILKLTEDLFTKLVKKIYPEKKITKTPWPRITHKEAIKKYKTDKPDLRKDKTDQNELAFAFVVDFPLFTKEKNSLVSEHHPFTAPKTDQIQLLDKEPEKAISSSYDIVLNGYEIGSGSLRIHDAELQKKIFKIIGIDEKEAEKKFGHLLQALSYGAPPHGGIAPGIDRLIMVLQNEPSIREVMAFPKTGDGFDPMMETPTEPTSDQLRDLNIKFIKK